MNFESSSSRGAWAEHAQAYHTHLELGLDPFQDKCNTPAFLSLMPDLSSQSQVVLDIGCGNGRFDVALLADRKNWTLTGFDSSLDLILHAKERNLPDAQFFVHDATQPFPFLNESFSLVIAKMLFPSMVSLDTTIKEAFRVLRRGGSFCISTLEEIYYNYLRENFLDSLESDIRSMKLSHEFNPKAYPFDALEKNMQSIARVIDQAPFAVWTKIAGSSFQIPVFQHTVEEITQAMEQAGFQLQAGTNVSCTHEFAKDHQEWFSRIGMNVIYNTVWKK